MSGDLQAIVARLEQVTTRLEGIAQGGGSSSAATAVELAESVTTYETDIEQDKLQVFLSLSDKIGGEVQEQSKLVAQGFAEMKKVLIQASTHKKPDEKTLIDVVKPVSNKVNAVQEYCDNRRASKSINNLKTISEGIGCLGWITVAPKPGPYIKECGDQALFYGNRVIKQYKGKDDTHVQWTRAYSALITGLQAYVKAHYTTGLTWNKSGPALTVVAAPPSAPSAGGPPPPPPPAIQPPSDAPSKKDDSSSERANLMAALNKGTGVTQGLRKVTDDMKTHKNPELRASSMVKAGAVKSSAKTTPKYGSSSTPVVKKPLLELQNKKWVVEYQEGKSDLSITDTNPKQSVYVYKCVKSTLKVSGKVNSIFLDNCKRVAVCFNDVISSVEVINSQSIQVQMMGKCPTVSIDKTDGCHVFLSKDSLSCEIISAKSSEMNISIPPPPGKQDFIERPVPEQFKTTWNGSTLVTECTDIAS